MKLLKLIPLLLACLVTANPELKAAKDAQWLKLFNLGILGQERTSVRNSPQQCVDGKLTVEGEDFPCKNVDFQSYISLQEMEITSRPHMEGGIRASDIWGWRSQVTGKEVTLICMDNGIAFVDTTNPVDPCILGLLPSPRPADTWCDIKVYEDVAYIVKDTRGGDINNSEAIGGQVFDLTRFDQLVCQDKPLLLAEDHLWTFHGSSHNLVIDNEAGFLYSVGGEQCSGGFVVMDLKQDKLRPQFVGCIDSEGYTHDAQCVIYTGPDTRHTGKELCFAFNEDHMVIWDVVDKLNPILLSKMTYPGQVYTHQGWLTADMSVILLDDELNEVCNGDNIDAGLNSICTQKPLGPLDGDTRTSTYFIDVSDLEAPILTGTYRHVDSVVDHNLYFWGPIHANGWGGNEPLSTIPNPNLAYLHNYESGLRIFDTTGKTSDTFIEVAYFDCAPESAGLNFLGSWSGYMFPSGNYVISSVERGLFVVRPTDSFIETTPSDDEDNSTTDTVLRVFAAVIILIGAAGFVLVFKRKGSKESVDHYGNENATLGGTPAPPNANAANRKSALAKSEDIEEERPISSHEL